MRTEEFPAIVHYRCLIGGQVCQLALVTQAIYHVIPDPGLAGGGGVGVPDELTVQLPRGENHRQLADFER